MMNEGFVDIISLLETFVLGTVSLIAAYTSYYPAPKQPEVQSASTIAVSPTGIVIDEIGMGPIITDQGPTTATESAYISPTPTIKPVPTTKPTNAPAPTPMLVKLPTKTPTRTPTKIPTSTPTRQPSPTPTPTVIPVYTATASAVEIPGQSLNPERIFQLINAHREELHLPPFQKHDYLCKLANDRKPELYNEIFGTAYVHQGLYDRNLPYWITENMASYPTEEKIVSWWLNSTIHRRAIEGPYTYSCGACSGNSCTQLFTNFVSR